MERTMLKWLSTVLLSAGLFLGLTPAAASAAYEPSHHYRCMYHCRDRHDGYHRYRHPRHRYCWYRDRYGWYQARCHNQHHDDDDDDRRFRHDDDRKHRHDDD
jgi:hypothetical protein